MKKIFGWILKNRIEFALLFLILAIAAFLRLWRISEYMTFLGDEGRDAIVVKNLITRGDLIFIGPVTSIGNMYLGPLYYYMMAPFLAISRLDPVGPAAMVALIGTVTVFLVYLCGRLFFSKESGLFAASLYAVAPVVIIYSRFSWNPNTMPFFALLTILFLYQSLKTRNYFWLLGVGVSFAFVLQMHYLGALLAPLLVGVWVFLFWELIKKKKPLKNFLLFSLLSFILFFLLMSPLLIFDLNPNHKFLNFDAFWAFFVGAKSTGAISNASLGFSFNLTKIYSTFGDLFVRFLVAKEEVWRPSLIILAFSILIVFGFLISKSKKNNYGYFIILAWLVIGVFGLSFLKGEIFDHYFGVLNPLPYLIFGMFLYLLWRTNSLLRALSILIFCFLLFTNFKHSPFASEPNNQLGRTKLIARQIIKSSSYKPLNFALIAQNNYDDAYRYFLDIWGHNPIVIDNQNLKTTITDQLFVVCEDQICKPLGYPKWEVASFGKEKGLAVIEDDLQFDGVGLFKLVHSNQLN